MHVGAFHDMESTEAFIISFASGKSSSLITAQFLFRLHTRYRRVLCSVLYSLCLIEGTALAIRAKLASE
jgi:hypothetical protein